MKTEEKTIITPYSNTRLLLHPNNQKPIKSTIAMFQRMKIMLMLLSALETSAKRFTFSKNLKKMVTKDRFI